MPHEDIFVHNSYGSDHLPDQDAAARAFPEADQKPVRKEFSLLCALHLPYRNDDSGYFYMYKKCHQRHCRLYRGDDPRLQ